MFFFRGRISQNFLLKSKSVYKKWRQHLASLEIRKNKSSLDELYRLIRQSAKTFGNFQWNKNYIQQIFFPVSSLPTHKYLSTAFTLSDFSLLLNTTASGSGSACTLYLKNSKIDTRRLVLTVIRHRQGVLSKSFSQNPARNLIYQLETFLLFLTYL